MLKIWGRVNSINVMKVLWCCAELDLKYERVDAGMEHGVVDEDFYARLNPNRKVPTIEDDGLVLWESNVIVRYLAAKHGHGTLYPEDIRVRAVAEQWMDWQQTSLNPDVGFIFWGLIRNRAENKDPAKLAAAGKRLENLWSMLETQLSDRPFVCGKQLTMGDIPIGAVAWRYFNLPIEHPRLPNVEAWHERLKERAGFREFVALPLS
ncbi:MAG: glutathione S-transferase family protein [Gammaproteobacteria bacterium]|nr:glutathione S-transferase family protein [Gammaproteobacteria bacterium]